MTAAARQIMPAASLAFLQDVFRERCEARALLFAAGEFDLHEAVDGLQQAADDYGLIAAFGQDRVQAVMAAAFHSTVGGAESSSSSSSSSSSPSSTSCGLSTDERLATSTVQAVEYLIQQNDPKRLHAWLAKHTRSERLAIRRHFERRKK